MNRAIRTEQPVLLPDRPWEAGGIVGDSSVTVMEDEGLYKLWYEVNVPLPAPGQRKAGRSGLSLAETGRMDKKTLLDCFSATHYMLCYATSKDGIHWEKPNLGVYKFGGSSKNNIVMAGIVGSTVFKDPTARPDKRYKLTFGGGGRMPHIHVDKDIPPYPGYEAIRGAHSGDGIHWKVYGKPVIPWYVDNTGVCYWDESIRKYVAFVRWNENMTYKDGKTYLRGVHGITRHIGRTESKDFRSFPTPVRILGPTPQELGPVWKRLELYNPSAVKYPFAADSYFMFPSYYYPHCEMLDVHLATSRDGVNYTRWREPFLGVGQQDGFDSMMVFMGVGMIRKGAEVDMYYAGADYLHDIRVHPAGAGGIGRARIRLDGFVSQDAPRSGGTLVTVPVEQTGSRLELNMDASAGGWLKVELLDRAGRAIPGYSRKDADRLRGNDVSKEVTWRGQSDLPHLKGKRVRLNFIGGAVKLYSFQFSD